MHHEPTPPATQAGLAQAERDEEWALVVLVAWLVLLAFIVVVLVFSPWPWGAGVGLLVWALGARGVYEDFSVAVARSRDLRERQGESGVTSSKDASALQ